MLLLRKFLLLLPCFLLLSACGFRPVHAPATETQQQLQQVYVETIPDRSGQLLRRHLQDRLLQGTNPPANRYHLGVTLREDLNYLGIEATSTSSYAKLMLTGTMTLKDTQNNNKIVLQQQVRSAHSFAIVTSPYASAQAEQDAREKSLRNLADSIVSRLIQHFAQTDG